MLLLLVVAPSSYFSGCSSFFCSFLRLLATQIWNYTSYRWTNYFKKMFISGSENILFASLSSHVVSFSFSSTVSLCPMASRMADYVNEAMMSFSRHSFSSGQLLLFLLEMLIAPCRNSMFSLVVRQLVRVQDPWSPVERNSGTNRRSPLGRHLVPSSSVRGRLRKELFLRKISGAGLWTDRGGGGGLEGVRGYSVVYRVGRGGASGHFRHEFWRCAEDFIGFMVGNRFLFFSLHLKPSWRRMMLPGRRRLASRPRTVNTNTEGWRKNSCFRKTFSGRYYKSGSSSNCASSAGSCRFEAWFVLLRQRCRALPGGYGAAWCGLPISPDVNAEDCDWSSERSFRFCCFSG